MTNLLPNRENNTLSDLEKKCYIYFSLGNSKYALDIKHVLEVMKLPNLDYPQKLPNNFIGILNYNNITINILDLRFYLDIAVTPYDISNKLLIVKTDESIMGLIVQEIGNVKFLDKTQIEHLPYMDENKLINYIHHDSDSSISVINLYSLESLIKKGVADKNVDIPALFPNDDLSKYKLAQRTNYLREKSSAYISHEIFSKDKFIAFKLNENNYAIDLQYVKEALKNAEITTIPCSPDYIEGIITVRGEFITIVNSKKIFDINPNDYENKNRVIIIEYENYFVGFLVDEICEIFEVPKESITPKTFTHEDKFVLNEILHNDKLFMILDMKKILSDEKFYIDET